MFRPQPVKPKARVALDAALSLAGSVKKLETFDSIANAISKIGAGFNQALTLFQESKDEKGEAEVRAKISQVYEDLGDWLLSQPGSNQIACSKLIAALYETATQQQQILLKSDGDAFYDEAVNLYNSLREQKDPGIGKKMLVKMEDRFDLAVRSYQQCQDAISEAETHEIMAQAYEKSADWLADHAGADQQACLSLAAQFYRKAIREHQILKRPVPFALYLSDLHMAETLALVPEGDYAAVGSDLLYDTIEKNIAQLQLAQLLANMPEKEKAKYSPLLAELQQRIAQRKELRKQGAVTIRLAANKKDLIGRVPVEESKIHAASASQQDRLTYAQQFSRMDGTRVFFPEKDETRRKSFLIEFDESGELAKKFEALEGYIGFLREQVEDKEQQERLRGWRQSLLVMVRSICELAVTQYAPAQADINEQRQLCLELAGKLFVSDSSSESLSKELGLLGDRISALKDFILFPRKRKSTLPDVKAFEQSESKAVVGNEMKEPAKPKDSSLAKMDSSKGSRAGFFPPAKRQKGACSESEIIAAIETNEVEVVSDYIRGNDIGALKRVSKSSEGDDFLMYALRCPGASYGVIAALFSRELLSLKRMASILSPKGTNDCGDSVVSLAFKTGKLACLRDGIELAAAREGLPSKPYLDIIENTIKRLGVRVEFKR